MYRLRQSGWLRAIALLAAVLAARGSATSQTQYVITNDDPGVSFYTVSQGGLLTLQQQVQIGGFGTVAGFFGANRLNMLDGGGQQCVFASIPSAGEISGIVISTLTVGGTASGSPTDNGAANGIGLASNTQYLYASFSSSNTIGTFAIQPGCDLSFINDVSAAGLAGGQIDGMTIHGNIMITTFTDRSSPLIFQPAFLWRMATNNIRPRH